MFSTQIFLIILFLFTVRNNATEFPNGEVRIGILHSLTGSMAISETTLRDVVLYLIDEQNAKGGLLGKKLVPVVRDPASCWPCFAVETARLIEEDVVAIFGCWTSISRKFVLPVVEERNALLFYPAIPAVDYMFEKRNITRFVLLGTMYVYPVTTNRILNAYLKNELHIPDEDILTLYTPFGHSDWDTIVEEIIEFSQGAKTAIISTINGDANTPFYQTLAQKGISADELPSIAFSVGEGELVILPQSDLDLLVGHLACWNYFESINNTLNNDFRQKFKEYVNDQDRVVNDPMEAHYLGFRIWVQAVEQARTFDVDAVRQAIYGQKVMSLSGHEVVMNENHYLTKPVYIGKVKSDAQFEIVESIDELVKGEAYSPYINVGDDKVCDWTFPAILDADL